MPDQGTGRELANAGCIAAGGVPRQLYLPAGLIVVWQMGYPVQHVLDAVASMASSATFRGDFVAGSIWLLLQQRWLTEQALDERNYITRPQR